MLIEKAKSYNAYFIFILHFYFKSSIRQKVIINKIPNNAHLNKCN